MDRILYLLLFLLLSPLNAYSEADNNTQVPADLLFKYAANRYYVLSPDGKYIASLGYRNEQEVLLITDVSKKEVIQTVKIGAYPESINWKGNRVILGVKKVLVEIGLDNSTPRVILGVEDRAKKGKKRVAMQWKMLNPLNDDQENILVSGWDYYGRLSKVYTYNVYTGDLEAQYNIKAGPDDTTWYFDGVGKLRVGIRHKRGALDIFTPKKGKLKLNRSIAMGSAPKGELIKKDGTQLANRVKYLGGDKDRDTIYVAHSLASDRFQIYAYSLAKKDFVDSVLSSESYDIGGAGSGTDLVYDWDASLVGIKYLEQKKVAHWLDPRLKTLQQRIDKIFPNSQNVILNFDRKREVLLVERIQNRRGVVYIYETKKSQFTRLAGTAIWLEDYDLASEKTVQYTARDGSEHYAFLTAAVDSDEGAKPLVIIPSTGLWSRWIQGYTAEAKYFASQGYAVLRVNHRGTWGMGREYAMSGIKEGAKLATDDIADAAKWAVDQNIAKPGQVFLYAKQSGGTRALLASLRNPERFAGVVIDSAPLKLRAAQRYAKKHDFDNLDEYYHLLKQGSAEDLKTLSPYTKLPHTTVPTMLFYGEKSVYLSKGDAKKLLKKSKASTNNITLNTIKDEKSSIKKNVNKVYVVEKAFKFFNDLRQKQQPTATDGKP